MGHFSPVRPEPVRRDDRRLASTPRPPPSQQLMLRPATVATGDAMKRKTSGTSRRLRSGVRVGLRCKAANSRGRGRCVGRIAPGGAFLCGSKRLQLRCVQLEARAVTTRLTRPHWYKSESTPGQRPITDPAAGQRVRSPPRANRREKASAPANG